MSAFNSPSFGKEPKNNPDAKPGKAPFKAGLIPEAPMAEKKKEAVREFPLPFEYSSDGKKLYVFDLELEMPECPTELRQFVPPMEKFSRLCYDQRTLEVLYKAAEAYKLGEPCLFEGEPATSKTTGVELLASLLGQPYRRMNYNGQTDSSELIGKFVPNDGDTQILFEQMLKNPSSLKEESKKIMHEAQGQNRALTKFESQKIAASEGLKISDWKWEDGYLTFCATKGCILLNDELGFAEPQILGRGLSSLEKNPSIEVSENGGLVIRKLNEEEEELWRQGKLKGVIPLNGNFRQYGATNPAETHAGRVTFEPAYKDRWLAYKFIRPPVKEEYVQMMELAVYGKQPVVKFLGDRYQAENTWPLYPVLREIGNFSGFIEKLAKFHVTLEEMARKREIGMSKKDKYIFTRRTLIEFLDYLENKKIVVDRAEGVQYSVKDMPKEVILRALQYYYLDKISDPDDLKKVMDQLDAVGISPGNWTHKFVEDEDNTRRIPISGSSPVSAIVFKGGKVPETVPRKKFEFMFGGTVERGERAALEDLRVGDEVMSTPTGLNRGLAQIAKAKKIVIVGFTDGDRVIVQTNEGNVDSLDLPTFRMLFEKVSSASQKIPEKDPEKDNRFSRIFTTLAETKVEVGFATEMDIFKIGDKLVFNGKGNSVNSALENAKKLVVVGFSLKGDVVVQIDGEKCLVDSPAVIKWRFVNRSQIQRENRESRRNKFPL